MTPSHTQRACTRHPEWFLQPGEQDNWDRTPQAEAARNLCAACPFGTRDCATEAIADDTLGTPDGVILAGVVCRGDLDTLYRLRAAAGHGLAIVQDAPELEPTPTCAGCNRPFADGINRPEGTVHLAARGLCRTCYSAAKRAGTLEAPRAPRPDNCIDCTEPMVPNNQQAPRGYVRHESGGRCTACTRRHNYQERTAA